MADSLTGAITGSKELDTETKNVLTSVISSLVTKDTAASVETVAGATVIQGVEAGGQTIAALVTGTTGFTGVIDNGNFDAQVALPPGVSLVLKGLEQTTTSTGAETYFNSLIDSAVPASTKTNNELRTSLLSASKIVTEGAGDGQSVSVRLVNFTDNNSATHTSTDQVVINGQGSGANTALTNVVAVNTDGLNHNQTIVLENIPRAVIVGEGSVKVTNTAPTLVVGDNSNQSIVGGVGNDTLVGGGGNDTLVGGLGHNTFGFNSGGHFTLSDFDPSKDKLHFMITGVSNIDQLKSLITSVTYDGHATTYHFGPNNEVTVLGTPITDPKLIDFN